MKKLLNLLIISLFLFACSSKDSKNEEKEEAKYHKGDQLSLGYNLPSITFEEEYDDWDLNNGYFGGKNVDEAYMPIYDTNKDRIIVYRNKIDNQSLNEYAENELNKYGYQKTQNSKLLFFDDETPYCYYTNSVEIDSEMFLSQKYIYQGTVEFVTLEYLTPMNKIDIADSNVYMYVPTNMLMQYAEDYIYSYYDETNIIPSIYVSRIELESEQEISEIVSESSETEEIDLENYSFEEYLQENSNQDNVIYEIDYHQELENYLTNMYELFDINDAVYSSLSHNDETLEILKLEYKYLVENQTLKAKEINWCNDNYLYTICLCANDDNIIQNSMIEILLNNINHN